MTPSPNPNPNPSPTLTLTRTLTRALACSTARLCPHAAPASRTRVPSLRRSALPIAVTNWVRVRVRARVRVKVRVRVRANLP